MRSKELSENKNYEISHIKKNIRCFFIGSIGISEEIKIKDVVIFIEKNTLESKLIFLTEYGIRFVYMLDFWYFSMEEIG